MKKIILTLLILAIFFPAAAEIKKAMELTGGYSIYFMSKLNEDMDNSEKELEDSGVEPDFNKINSGFSGGMAFMGMFGESLNPWAIYLKADVLNAVSAGNKVSSGDIAIMESSLNASCFYGGLGVRKYFNIKLKEPFIKQAEAYAGIDAGIGNSFLAVYEEKYFDASGNEAGTAKADLEGILWGASLEAGGNAWLNDFFGLTAKFGLRYLSGKMKGNLNKTGTVLNTGSNAEYTLDYTGPYISAGVIFTIPESQAGSQQQNPYHEDTSQDSGDNEGNEEQE